MCVLYHATFMKKKFETTVHIGNVRQTAVIEDISSVSRIGTDDRAVVTFRFIKHPEYITIGSRLLFRGGLGSNGYGTIIAIL